jgi:tripartite-type tricarboxylate transporter receptor subunit TctC
MLRKAPIALAGIAQAGLAQAGLALLLLCTIPLVQSAQAADYPTRPVTLVVAFPPGGASDVLSRILARGSSRSGQPFVVDNRPGRRNVAADVARAAPDGLLQRQQQHPRHQRRALQEDLRSEADFAPITDCRRPASWWSIRAAVTSMAKLVALAKACLGKLNFASSGHGLAASRRRAVQDQAKIDLVPYKARRQPTGRDRRPADMFATASSGDARIRDAAVRALGVATLAHRGAA